VTVRDRSRHCSRKPLGPFDWQLRLIPSDLGALARLARVITYRIGEAAELLGVSSDTVRRLADAGRIPTIRRAGEARLIDAAGLASYMASLPRPEQPESIAGQSARNQFPGIVTKVIKDKVAAQVEIQAGPHRVVALLTREAVDELGLVPGVRAIASVKATNVVIELPRERREGRRT